MFFPSAQIKNKNYSSQYQTVWQEAGPLLLFKALPQNCSHYTTAHANEKEVVKGLAYPKKSKERKKQLEKLRLWETIIKT